MDMLNRTWALYAVGTALCLAGCNSEDVNNLRSDTSKLGHDIAPIVTSATLQTKVVTHLSLHKGIDMSGLHIETSDKKVTVSGHVRDAGMRKKVIDTVKETSGVEQVEDKLNVQQ